MPDFATSRVTRRDWTELAVSAVHGGVIIHWFGYAVWAIAGATFMAGWLYGRWELRQDIRNVLTEDPDHAT